jgi:hypothetical protein
MGCAEEEEIKRIELRRQEELTKACLRGQRKKMFHKEGCGCHVEHGRKARIGLLVTLTRVPLWAWKERTLPGLKSTEEPTGLHEVEEE